VLFFPASFKKIKLEAKSEVFFSKKKTSLFDVPPEVEEEVVEYDVIDVSGDVHPR
jgi:hypothetical protein